MKKKARKAPPPKPKKKARRLSAEDREDRGEPHQLPDRVDGKITRGASINPTGGARVNSGRKTTDIKAVIGKWYDPATMEKVAAMQIGWVLETKNRNKYPKLWMKSAVDVLNRGLGRPKQTYELRSGKSVLEILKNAAGDASARDQISQDLERA